MQTGDGFAAERDDMIDLIWNASFFEQAFSLKVYGLYGLKLGFRKPRRCCSAFFCAAFCLVAVAQSSVVFYPVAVVFPLLVFVLGNPFFGPESCL